MAVRDPSVELPEQTIISRIIHISSSPIRISIMDKVHVNHHNCHTNLNRNITPVRTTITLFRIPTLFLKEVTLTIAEEINSMEAIPMTGLND